MKIGLWHEGLVGEDLQTNESSFSIYVSEYVKFVTDNNIDRAFFILHDPNSKDGKYLKEQRMLEISKAISKTFPKGIEYDRFITLLELSLIHI